jgi:hypothetical protein
MKTKSLHLLGTFLFMCVSAFGWAPKGDGWQMIEKGPNHQRWSRVTWTTNGAGARVLKTNNVVALATGMNRWEKGKWVESNPHILPTTNGALCVGAGHQVVLAPNLNTRAAVQIRSPQGNWIQGNVLGLAYTDTAKHKSVLIAQVKDCVGIIADSNHVLYADAFSGMNADVRYAYTKAGFEQDVILREAPPAPEAFGLNSNTVALVVITEFIETPAPKPLKIPSPEEVLAEQGLKNIKVNHSESETNWMRAANADPLLDFCGMTLSYGKAFQIGESDGHEPKGYLAPVRRHWQVQGKRSFLVEEVAFPQVQDQLQKLPHVSQVSKPKPAGLRNRVMDHLPLPEMLLARKDAKPMLLAASAKAEPPGFVLDYDFIGGGSSSFVFNGDTYVICGQCVFNAVVFSGGAVIKYEMFTSPDGSDASIFSLYGGWFDNTRIYFTSTEDSTVGEDVNTTENLLGGYQDGNGSFSEVGVPAMALYKEALCFYQGIDVENVEVRYAGVGIEFRNIGQQPRESYIHDSSFVDCGIGVWVTGLVDVDVGYCTFYTSDGTPVWIWPDIQSCGDSYEHYSRWLYNTMPFFVQYSTWRPIYQQWNYMGSVSAWGNTYNMCASTGFSDGNGNYYSPPKVWADFGGGNCYVRPYYGWVHFDLNGNNIPDFCEGYWQCASLRPPPPPPPPPDVDNDSLADPWELQYFGNLNFNGSMMDASGVHTIMYDYTNGVSPIDLDGDLRYDQPFSVRIFSPK